MQELIDTEISYGEVLNTVVDTYIPFMEESKKETRDKGVPPMPEELKAGRDKIALCNIRQIHTYQKKLVAFQNGINNLFSVLALYFKHIRNTPTYRNFRMVAPDVLECIENTWKLRHIFTCKQEKLKDYYGRYSINKPKSELIVEGSKEYFQVSMN